MDIQSLLADYTSWLKEETTTAIFGEYIEITTPFLDRFNDYLQIYVRYNSDGTMHMTDDGYIIGNLLSSGVSLRKGSKKQKELEQIARKFGVTIVKEEVTTKATPHDFPQRKHLLIQALLAIDDLYAISPEGIENSFYEDVETYFAANDIYFTRNFPSLGKSGYIQTYDYHFQRSKEKPERFCNGYNRLNHASMERSIMSWLDTQERRGEGEEYIIIFNDSLTVAQGILTGFHNYGVTTLPFSQRQEPQYLQLFTA